MKRNFFACAFAALLLVAGLPLCAASLNVFAAASLTDGLKEIAANYEKQTGDKIVLNLGASSTLARQIEEGVPADVFFSADEAKMNGLEKKGLVIKETRKSRLSNSLVIVVSAENGVAVKSPKDLGTGMVKRLALAEPKTVPAGIYAKEFLQKQNLWSAVEGKVIPTENVRAALAAVESGDVDAAIVYKTDAAISRKVKVAYEVPQADNPDISYPVAVVKESGQVEAATRFVKYLDSADAEGVFQKLGFIVRK